MQSFMKMTKRVDQLNKVGENLAKFSQQAQEVGIYPVGQKLKEAKELLEKVNEVMVQVESRTLNTEWESVPLIGASASNSSRLKSVQQEVIYHLKKSNQDSKEITKDVSAWDVANEYRDAVLIGSSKNVEAINNTLVL
jgi:hypothetical protein